MEIATFQKRLAYLSWHDNNKLFDNLYRYIKSPETLRLALDTVLSMAVAHLPGVDGKSKRNIHSREYFVLQLTKELDEKTYCPQPAQKVALSLPDHRRKAIGLPSLKDRTVQEAIRMVLEPIFESRFIPYALGFRPGKTRQDAVHLATNLHRDKLKYFWVIKCDLSNSTEDIPHRELTAAFRRHISCKKTLKLIKATLQAGYLENDRLSKPNQGIFQGGILRPLLLNIYWHEFDQYWINKYFRLTPGQKDYRRKKGLGNVFYIRFADECLILTNGNKAFAQQIQAEAITASQQLNRPIREVQTTLIHLNDGYDFLDFRIQRVYSERSARHIPLVGPTAAAIQQFKDGLSGILSAKNIGLPAELIFQACNRFVKSWETRYRYANRSQWAKDLNEFYWTSVYYWLKRKHSNVSSQGSIFKHVYLKYSCKKSSWNLGWRAGKTAVKRIREKAARYSLRKQETNIYLTDEAIEYRGEDFSSLRKIWQGHSSKASYIHLQESLMARDKGCVQCGATRKLDIHHIIPQKEGGAHNLNNTVLLCRDCHAREHR